MGEQPTPQWDDLTLDETTRNAALLGRRLFNPQTRTRVRTASTDSVSSFERIDPTSGSSEGEWFNPDLPAHVGRLAQLLGRIWRHCPHRKAG